MRILAISDLFPPHFIGGYELACEEVMSRLARRGHHVRVLTSDYRRPGVDETRREPLEVDETRREPLEVERIYRFRRFMELRYPARPWTPGLGDALQEREVKQTTERAISRFRPDLISIWKIGNISPTVLTTCLATRLPIVAAVSDYWIPDLLEFPPQWLAFWCTGDRKGLRTHLKRAIEGVMRDCCAATRFDVGGLQHAHFCSDYLRADYLRRGIQFPNSIVVHHGVDLGRYRYLEQQPKEVRRLLFAGRLVPEKGVEVAIRSMDILTREFGHDQIELHLVGDGSENYINSLKLLINKFKLSDRVQFVGGRPHIEMPYLYSDYNIMIMTSLWQEPFSITLIEAMACGVPVIATATGGSPEVLHDGFNGILVEADRPDQLAQGVDRLIRDPACRECFRVEARRSVESMCDLDRTALKIEDFYVTAASSHWPPKTLQVT